MITYKIHILEGGKLLYQILAKGYLVIEKSNRQLIWKKNITSQ
jgi:hypothetical protein